MKKDKKVSLFKVGDKVRLVDTRNLEDIQHLIGKVGVIQDMSPELLNVTFGGSRKYSWYHWRVELAMDEITGVLDIGNI